MKVVLGAGELLGEVSDMMIENDRDGADRLPLGVPVLSHQMVTDEITDGFRPSSVFLADQRPVEVVQQVVVQRHRKADGLLHREPPSCQYYEIIKTYYQQEKRKSTR